MKKYVKSDKYLAVSGLSLFVFSAAGIAALCLLNNSTEVGAFTLSQLLGIVAAVAILTYICALCVVAARKKSVGDYSKLSVEVMFASVFLIGLLPMALIVLIIETICESVEKRRAEKYRQDSLSITYASSERVAELTEQAAKDNYQAFSELSKK